jgi:uncharacterized protein (TIGR00369 family)
MAGGVRMDLGARTRNSYGAPLGGALGTLIVESAQEALGASLQRVHVRFLATSRGDGIVATPHLTATGCEVKVVDEEGRLSAFGTAEAGVVPLDAPESPTVINRTVRRAWEHVALLGELAIGQSEPSNADCFEMPISGLALGSDGIAHAGAIFTLVDLAAGQLAQSTPPVGPVVTLDAEVRLFRSVRRGSVRAVGGVLQAGRRLVTTEVTVEDTQGTIARGTVSMLRVGD